MVTTLGIDKWMSVNFTHCLGLVKVKMVSIVAALITASRVLFEGGGGHLSLWTLSVPIGTLEVLI